MSGISNPMDDVVGKLTPPLQETISTAIKNNFELGNLSEFKQVAGWIKESKMDPLNAYENPASPISRVAQNPYPTNVGVSNADSVFSGLANKIIANLMQHVPSYFGQLLLDNIRIQTQGIKKSVKFDLEFTLDPIRPYVEFVKMINGIETLKIKTLFQIDSDVKMFDLGFLSDETERIIHLGNLLSHVKISLLQFSGFHGAVSVNKPKVLKELEFEKDLSEIKLSL